MRIVQVYKDYYPPTVGGIEQTVERMARWCLARGDEVTVLTSNPGKRRTTEETVNGVHVIRVAEYARALSTPLCPTMARHLARIPADVHHLHYPNPTGELSWLAVRPRAPMVMTYHGDVIRQAPLMPFYGPFVHAVLGGAALVMPTSDNMIRRSKFLQAHRDHVRVVPLGIDLEPFLAADPRGPAASAMRARYPGPIVLFVGRLIRQKGLDVLIQAMRDVPATLLIVGNGPEREALERQVRDAGIADRVVFPGRIEPRDVPAWMAAADVGVLPSVTPAESFGLSMVEMMGCGLPIVCTELGTGTSFVNQDGESGFVVAPGDAPALAAALRRLLQDEALRRRMGEAARARAVRMFSTEAMMRQVAEVYAEVTSKRRAA